MKFSWRFAAVVTLAVLLVACSSSDSTDVGPITSDTYSGPGSFYEATFNDDGTFTIEVADTLGQPTTLTVNGTYTRLDTGFMKLTVSSSEGDNGPSAGDQALAIEIPGYAMILKPLGGDELIPLMSAGGCPEDDFIANWIIVQNSDDRPANEAGRDWFGTFSWTVGEPNTAGIPSAFDLASFAAIPGSIQTFDSITCDNGIAQITDAGQVNANLWLTSLGGAIVETFNTGVRNSSIIGVPAQSVSLLDFEGTWAGLVLQASNSNEDERIFPVKVVLDANGSGTGQEYADVETGAVESDGVTLAFTQANNPATGFVTGTITSGSNSGNVVCALATAIGDDLKSVAFCAGQDPSDNTKQFGVMLARND